MKGNHLKKPLIKRFGPLCTQTRDLNRWSVTVAGRSGGRTDEMTGDRRVGSLAPTQNNPGVSAQVAPARAWPPLCRAAMYSPTRQMRSSIILLRAPDDSAGHYSRLSAASGSLGGHTPGGHDRPAGSALRARRAGVGCRLQSLASRRRDSTQLVGCARRAGGVGL